MNSYLFYYNNYKIQNLIVKYLFNRETVALPSKRMGDGAKIRNMRIHNTQSFRFWMDFIRMFQNKHQLFNLYYSMARFEKGVPYRYVGGGNLKEDFSEWNKDLKQKIVSYDMLIDIDAGEPSEMPYAAETANMLKRVFDAASVPYYLRNSCMGFHYVVPYEYFDPSISLNPDDGEDSIYYKMQQIAVYLNETYSDMIDTTIYDSRRIAKIPYSIGLYPHGDFVCLPVNNLTAFDYKCYSFDIIRRLSNVPMDILHNPKYRRGVLEKWANV